MRQMIHPNARPIHHPNATPNPHNPCEPGVAFGPEIVTNGQDQLPNAAPLQPRLVLGLVETIALNFKSVTTRSVN
ncbi:hypothetical protein [Leptodesmis sichuanensis]|uniref:hypothetical protein n=1 Tax=Leptodesmis sichuanensis TaxID=2906798 RepID=UPI001F289326|nr:hypothetical protein [Leptodesmis sichuanensis]UIE40123.1 hypothetical protein KIK02_11615 [Leptodesmis sichuanensis A121]